MDEWSEDKEWYQVYLCTVRTDGDDSGNTDKLTGDTSEVRVQKNSKQRVKEGEKLLNKGKALAQQNY